MDNTKINLAIGDLVNEALHGPLGPIPLQRVVLNHLSLFDELRNMGVPWESISARLKHEGLDRTAKWWRTAYSNASSRARISKVK